MSWQTAFVLVEPRAVVDAKRMKLYKEARIHMVQVSVDSILLANIIIEHALRGHCDHEKCPQKLL